MRRKTIYCGLAMCAVGLAVAGWIGHRALAIETLSQTDVVERFGPPIAVARNVEYRRSGRAVISGMELVVEGLRGEPLRTEDRIWIFSDNEQARLVIKQILDQRFGPQSSSSGYFVFSPRTKLTVVDWGSGGGAMGRVRKYSVDFLVPTD